MALLQGKIALITGGTSGIGAATARLFHAQGATVIVTGRNEATLAQARQELPAGIEVLRADAADLAELDALFAGIKARHGALDVLFVNAGTGRFLPVEATDEAMWDQTMNVNLKGAFFTVQKALPLLRKGGSIVFTSSIAGHRGIAGGAAYSASKAGLSSLGRTLAQELAGRGIRVNTISPGPIETPIFGKMGLPAEALDQFTKTMLGKVPLQRFGQPEEIAQTALFLASGGSSFITGQELVADGGVLLG